MTNAHKKAQRKYDQSEKGRATKRKYQQSERGRAAQSRYNHSDKGMVRRAAIERKAARVTRLKVG